MTIHRSYYGSMPSTRWVMIADAVRIDDDGRRPGLDALLARYIPALKAHLIFQRRIPPERAEDLLQSFVVNKVLEHALIERADPARGRFRTFLLTALDRFVISQIRADQAIRRTPGPTGLSDLREQIEADRDPAIPSTAFEVEWARQVLDDALGRMYATCRATDRLDLWGVFEARLLGPLLDGVKPPSYAEMLEQFGFASPAQASNALMTAKRMFARTLRAVVADYIRDPEQIELELHELQQILSHSRS